VRRALVLLLLVGCTSVSDDGISIESPSPAAVDGHLVEAVGIETLGGVFTPLLQKGCALPCELAQVFSTADDNQREILIHLFRGKEAMVKDAHDLGSFKVSGFRPAPRGHVQVSVRFIATEEGLRIAASEVGVDSSVHIARAAP
jgi:molecular chaperone DnaK (HSP70)